MEKSLNVHVVRELYEGRHVIPGAWALLFFSLSSPTSAALAPEYYAQARNQAAYHVQVRVLSVNGPAKTPGECAITSEVVRIFRDLPGNLKQAARLAFTISCRKAGDERIVGGTLWQDYDSLLHAEYLEVFLNKANGGYAVAMWQAQVIGKPTNQPVMN